MNVKQKILIADDSEINRALLMEILGDGYEYLEAENGVRAVELLREHTDIALVLLDIMMPQMDGFDVLKVMRCYSWLDEIPVIMISAAKDTANIGPARPGQDRDPHRDPQQARPPDRRRIRDDQDPHGEGCPHPAGPEQHHRRGKRAPAAGGLCHLPLAP